MSTIRVLAAILMAVVFGLTSCNTDPNVAKKRYLQMGDKYFDRGNYKSADIMYRRALEKDKLYGAAYYKLGITYFKEGKLSLAVPQLRKAVDLLKKDDPNRWDALTKVTDIYLAVAHDPQHLKEADDNIKLLLARDPQNFDAHRMRGDLLYVHAIEARRRAGKEEAKQDLDEAMMEYRKADSIKPGQEGVMMQLAKSAVLEGDAPTAEKMYQQVIEKNKTLAAPYNELYRLYTYEGKRDEGEKLLKLAFQNNPKDYSFLISLALHYSIPKPPPGHDQRISSRSSRIPKIFPKAYQVVAISTSGWATPIPRFANTKKEWLRIPPIKPCIRRTLCPVLMAQHKRGEAADINQQILKDNPNDSDARSLEASFLLDKGDVARALSELQAVVTRSPDNAVARYNLGRAHLARAEWEQARQAFQKAIELRPDYMLARLALAQLLVTRGDFDAALKAAGDILKLDRDNKYAELIQSAALLGQKKYGDSRALLNRNVEEDAERSRRAFPVGRG